MEELIRHLEDHFITYTKISDTVVEIGGQTYELHRPNPSTESFFNTDFNWDCHFTEYDNYIYSFGGVWYWLKRGEERNVKLNPVLYIGKPAVDTDFQVGAFLGIHGMMQMMDGMHNYLRWCEKARWLGITTLGICEKGHLAGTFKFQEACLSCGIKPVFGMEVPVFDESTDSKFSVKVYARDAKGWKILLKLSKYCNIDHAGWCTPDELFPSLDMEHVHVILDPKTSRCGDISGWFSPEDVYVQLDTVEYEREERDEWYLNNLRDFYRKGWKFVAITDAYYLEKEWSFVRGKITSISKNSVYASPNQHFKNGQEYFYELESIFGNDDDGQMKFMDIYSDAIDRLVEIAGSCNFAIDSQSRHLPEYIMTPEEKKRWKSNDEMLEELIYEGVERHPEVLEKYGEDTIMARIDEELDVIRYGNVVDYFLILRDIVYWCRDNSILVGPGRGSAAGSLSLYLLDIVMVNPLDYGLFFSRFLNKGRIQVSLPDIDTDFPTKKRGIVKEYMERRFGLTQVCSVGTYGTLQLKNAINTLSDSYGIGIPERKRITKMLGDNKEKTVEDLFGTALKKAEFRQFMRKNTEMFNDLFVILGSPVNLSMHACAVMIFPDEGTMYEQVPIRMTKERDALLTQWEGTELDHAGFLKEDILGLNEVDKVSEIIELIEKDFGTKLNPYTDIPIDEPRVMEYFGNGWNGDVFQFTAKGMNGYVQQLKPNSLKELAVTTSLYRPGPLENGFHMKYIACKNGDEDVSYPPGTESFLKDTYALPLYQESVMQAFVTLAGFTAMEADTARRAMGKKKIDVMESMRKQFIEGYVKNWGVTEDYANDYFEQLLKFCGYSFNKCISGRETIYRTSGTSLHPFKPTIEEMYNIRNDRDYAITANKLPLRSKYQGKGYGSAWTLCKDGRIRKTSIADIQFAGVKKTYKVTLENDASTSVTDNHSFPTQRGKVMLKDLVVGQDSLYVNVGYKQDKCYYNFTNKGEGNERVDGTRFEFEQNSEKGKMGFQKRDSAYTRFEKFIEENRSKHKTCQICEKPCDRLELHHLDGDHGNSAEYNLAFVCPSCHKKEHYREHGRLKIGEKGLYSELVKIKSIEFDREETVYDVTIDHSEHNFVTSEGIVTCNSHAVAYSFLSYIAQWLKVHYPVQFWAVTFSWAKMDEYPYYIHEIGETGGIKVKPVDINHSGQEIVADEATHSMYWAFNSVKQLGDAALPALMKEREEHGQYFSLDEFIDRNLYKGSAVNKSVVENLIYSGAFDELEGVERPSDRYHLIEWYRTKKKVKVVKERDAFTIAKEKGKVMDDWWWSLMQKTLSGYGYFEHESLSQNLDDITQWVSPKELQTYNGYGWRMVKVGGYVTDVEEKKTARGLMGFVILENNYEFIRVIVGADFYTDLEPYLTEAKNMLMYITGVPLYSKFDNCWVIQVTKETRFIRMKTD